MITVDGKEVYTTLDELVSPGHTALLLIDIQNDYVKAGGHFDKMGLASKLGEIVPRVRPVLEAARRAGIMVVHMQMTYHADLLAESPAWIRGRLLRMSLKGAGSAHKLETYCVAGTWGWGIADELAPLPGETVVTKHRASAFIGTSLDLILRNTGIESVVLVGLVTQGCVLATANDAQSYGYYPVLLDDCIASQKPELHDAAMLIMSQVKDVAGSAEVIGIWDGSIRRHGK